MLLYIIKKYRGLQCHNHNAKPSGDKDTGKCYGNDFFVFLQRDVHITRRTKNTGVIVSLQNGFHTRHLLQVLFVCGDIKDLLYSSYQFLWENNDLLL